MKSKSIGIFKDNLIGSEYELVRFENAKELSAQLKSNLKKAGINYQEFNSSVKYNKDEDDHDDEGYKSIENNPPIEIYEYQNFFLLERKNGEHVLLDGFRRLLWYKAPAVPIYVRIYKESDLSNQNILTLLIYLNHFKFYSDSEYHDRGFALLLRTVFDLNIPSYRNAFDAYLSSDKTRGNYSNYDGSTEETKNSTIKERILHPMFISDMKFLETLNSSSCMVNKFVGAILFKERQKTDKEFNADDFIKHHDSNDVLKALIVKYKKVGTNTSSESQKVVNQLLEMYENIFVLMKGGKVEKSYAELTKECKDLSESMNKDKGWTKLTGNRTVYKVERVMEEMLRNKEELEFKCVVYPKTWTSPIPLEPGLLKDEIKFLRTRKKSLGGIDVVYGFIHNKKEFEIQHNYRGYMGGNAKKFVDAVAGSMPQSCYKIDLFVKIPKAKFKEEKTTV